MIFNVVHKSQSPQQPSPSDLCCSALAKGFHPVFLRESADAAGELHHPGAQTDGEPAASAGKRGQDSVLHGPRH